jgi:hypothetical protein
MSSLRCSRQAGLSSFAPQIPFTTTCLYSHMPCCLHLVSTQYFTSLAVTAFSLYHPLRSQFVPELLLYSTKKFIKVRNEQMVKIPHR